MRYITKQYRIYRESNKLTTNTQTEERSTTNTRKRKQRPILSKKSERPRQGTVQYGTVQTNIIKIRYKLNYQNRGRPTLGKIQLKQKSDNIHTEE